MNHAQRFVALGDVVDDDTERDHIVRPARNRRCASPSFYRSNKNVWRGRDLRRDVVLFEFLVDHLGRLLRCIFRARFLFFATF